MHFRTLLVFFERIQCSHKLIQSLTGRNLASYWPFPYQLISSVDICAVRGSAILYMFNLHVIWWKWLLYKSFNLHMKVSQNMETFMEFSFPDVNVWYRKLKIWSEWSSSYFPMHFPSYNTLNFELIFFMKNKISKNWSRDKFFIYNAYVKGLWFFNLIIIGKCQTRFKGGTKCHLLFSYSVILLYFTSSVCIRLFNMCTWCTGNITGSFIFSDMIQSAAWKRKGWVLISIYFCLKLV